jgi:uncharacterized caspase-like protein
VSHIVDAVLPGDGTRGVGVRVAEREDVGHVDLEVPLAPGLNTIEVLAFAGSEGRSEPIQVLAPLTRGADADRTLYVLAIGVSQYANSNLNLAVADKDARDFAAAMEQQRGRLHFGNVESRVLINQEATEEAIEKGIDWLVESADSDDVVAVFVSGHGLVQKSEYYFATHEADPESPRSSCLPWRTLEQMVEELPCQVLMFVDTCHAGGVVGLHRRCVDPIRTLGSHRLGAIVFGSSHLGALSQELVGNGAFTKALLQSLRDSASDVSPPPDGAVSVDELTTSLRNRVWLLTDRQQTPVTLSPKSRSAKPILSLVVDADAAN